MQCYLCVILTLISLVILAGLAAAGYYFYLRYQRRKLDAPIEEVTRNTPLLPDYGATDAAAFRV
jgi:hypothetical protein